MRTFLPIAAAAAALAAAASAQNSLTAKKITAPIQYLGTYHLSTGAWSGGARAGQSVLYNCTTPGNYYSNVGNSFATNADHLWIDEGVLADTNGSQWTQVNSFDFAYCSTDFDPSGTNGSVRVSFYDDHLPCATGETALCSYVITGLPLSSTGNAQCWAVSVDLTGGSECSTELLEMFRTTGHPRKTDPSFGWAFGANPGQQGMNNTGPVLDRPCLQPLRNCGSGGGLQGNQNFFAWEDPAGVWTGCYWFGGVPWASFSMKMNGGGRNVLAYYDATPTPSNLNQLSSGDYQPGGPLTLTATTSTGGTSYLLAAAASHSLQFPQGTLLVDTNFLVNPMPMPGGNLSVAVPVAVPPNVYVQVAETAGPATPAALRALSNGLQLLAAVGSAANTKFKVGDRGSTDIVISANAAGSVKVKNSGGTGGTDTVRVCKTTTTTTTTGGTTTQTNTTTQAGTIAPGNEATVGYLPGETVTLYDEENGAATGDGTGIQGEYGPA